MFKLLGGGLRDGGGLSEGRPAGGQRQAISSLTHSSEFVPLFAAVTLASSTDQRRLNS